MSTWVITGAGRPRRRTGWLGGWRPTHVEALCGHAHTDLAQATGDPSHLDRAHQALTTAAAHLAPVRPRAAALCLTHLARIHHKCGEPEHAPAPAGAVLTADTCGSVDGWSSSRIDAETASRTTLCIRTSDGRIGTAKVTEITINPFNNEVIGANLVWTVWY
jgi:hypothetical protein